jgi:hypothetical protein
MQSVLHAATNLAKAGASLIRAQFVYEADNSGASEG